MVRREKVDLRFVKRSEWLELQFHDTSRDIEVLLIGALAPVLDGRTEGCCDGFLDGDVFEVDARDL
jgi:hypothetical protein